ncbi:hypothetical protein G7054_g4735 [Neopestalotiopsis clavispora]|nr:hypothetical protein G7054_g4735 [Neopestalotiopsis clavispora]
MATEDSNVTIPPHSNHRTIESNSASIRMQLEDAVGLDSQKPSVSFHRMLQFLAVSEIPILDPDDVSRDELPAINRGASMEVFRGKLNKEAVALKYVRHGAIGENHDPKSEAKAAEDFHNRMYDILFELKIMCHKPLCDHRNIVKAYGITFDIDGTQSLSSQVNNLYAPVIVTELANPDFADLAALLTSQRSRELCISDLLHLISDIADGLEALHDNGITHSDVKPENILIFTDKSPGDQEFVAKISDFGAAGIQATNDHPRALTPYWTAPEALKHCSVEGIKRDVYEKTRDIYSFGLVVGYILLQGENPLDAACINGKGHTELKFADVADDVVVKSVSSHWEEIQGTEDSQIVLLTMTDIIRSTLRLHPRLRMGDLASIRGKLFETNQWAPQNLIQKFERREFAKRQNSPYADLINISDRDTVELPIQWSVMPFLPQALQDILLQDSGLNLKNYEAISRGLFHDSPSIIIKHMNDEIAADSQKRGQEWFQTLARLSRELDNVRLSTEEQSQPCSVPIAPQEHLDFTKVMKYGGDLMQFSMLCLKMQYWDKINQTESYKQVLDRVWPDLCDRNMFNLRDNRNSNKTLLHGACKVGDYRTAQFLLEHGANVNTTDEYGVTPWLQLWTEPFSLLATKPLNMYTESDSLSPSQIIELSNLLLSHGAQPEFSYSNIPLLILLETMGWDGIGLSRRGINSNKPALIDHLVRLGHPIDVLDSELGTPLSVAIRRHSFDSAKRFLRLGADANTCAMALDRTGRKFPISLLESLLVERTARDEDFKAAEILLEAGATIFPRRGDGYFWNASETIAHQLVSFGYHTGLEVLLKYCPLFALARDSVNRTPLLSAVALADVKSVRILLKYGSDPAARSVDGINAMMACGIPYRSSAMVQELKDTTLEIMRLLKQSGADLTPRQSWIHSPPTRLYVNHFHKTLCFSTAFSAADDSTHVPQIWKVCRNLHQDLGASGSALLLRPIHVNCNSNEDRGSLFDVYFVIANKRPGRYKFVAKFSVLDPACDPFALMFGTYGKSEASSGLLGGVNSCLLRTGYSYLVVSQEIVSLTEDSVFIGLSIFAENHEDSNRSPYLSGLVLDFVELVPDSIGEVLEFENEHAAAIGPLKIKEVSPVGHLAPQGVVKSLQSTMVHSSLEFSEARRPFDAFSQLARQ